MKSHNAYPQSELRRSPGLLAELLVAAGLLLSTFGRDGRYQFYTTVVMVGIVVFVLGRRADLLRFPVGIIPLLALWILASNAWSEWPSDSFAATANAFSWMLLASVLVSHFTRDAIVRIWLISSATLLVMIAITLLLSGGYSAGVDLVLFNSKNHLGFAAAISTVPLWAASQVKPYYAAAATALACYSCRAFNTQTGLLLCVLVPCAYFAILLYRRVATAHLRAVYLMLAAAITTVAFVRASELAESTAEAVGRDTTLSGRDELWESVYRAILERPLAGTGIGGVWTRPAEEPTRSILEGLAPHVQAAAGHAHNGWLEVALQLGLVGLAMFLWISAAALVGSLSAVRRIGDPLSIGLATGMVISVLGNMTESRVFNDQAWVLILAAYLLSLQQPPGQRSSAQLPGNGADEHLAADVEGRLG